MAELSPPASPPLHLPGTQEQLRAIAWLRWRILANSFRRKGGAGELIARIVLLVFFGALALVPTAGAGFFAWFLASRGHLDQLGWVLWTAFFVTQLLNINLGQPGTAFDPTELIRFPLPLWRFVLVRLSFGLLGTANLIIGLASLAVVVGITVARPILFLPALLALLVFGLTNILFNRMIFAWVDRWLSTRRARELFTAFIFLASLGFQALNARFNPGFQHGPHRRSPQANITALQRLAHVAHPVARWLPPSLIANALHAAGAGNITAYLAGTGLCTAFAAVFLWIYMLRMRTEFHGENLSETANLTRPPAKPLSPAPQPALGPSMEAAIPTTAALPRRLPVLAPLLGKELLVLRRNTGLFYGLIAPAVMVFLFAGRLSSRGSGGGQSHWVLLAAVAYALLGVAPLAYNSLGTEGTGAQFYFMAPVPLREVFFAKNVFTLLIALVEATLVIAITAFVAGRPSVSDCLFALLWAVGTLLFGVTVGNRRSLAAPRKVSPGRTMAKAQSPLSAYLSLGITLGCAAIGFLAELFAVSLGKGWVGALLMLAFAAGAALVYDRSLSTIEAYALEHRDTLFEELGKKT